MFEFLLFCAIASGRMLCPCRIACASVSVLPAGRRCSALRLELGPFHTKPIRFGFCSLHGQLHATQATTSSCLIPPKANNVSYRVRSRDRLGISEWCSLHLLTRAQIDECLLEACLMLKGKAGFRLNLILQRTAGCKFILGHQERWLSRGFTQYH